MTELHVIIMAGGAGTRFWPASRRTRPKQLLPLAHGESLLRATIDRVTPLAGPDRTWIVTNPVQAERIQSAVGGFPADRLIVEPEARDTAPCIALATAHVEAHCPGARMAVMPADHLIAPVDAFCQLVRRGADVAGDETTLVTFGIRPTWPATVYGYIETGPPIDTEQPPALRVTRFREKPDRETAERYLASGRFLWNAGIFVWTTRALLAAMEHGEPTLAEGTRTMIDAVRDGRREDARAAFLETPKTSIDFAVMEHAPRVAVIPAAVEWHDLGSFLALESVAPADDDGNVTVCPGDARALLADAKSCIVYGEGARTIALFGVEGLVVAAVDDAVLVSTRERVEDLKDLVQRLRDTGRDDLL